MCDFVCRRTQFASSLPRARVRSVERACSCLSQVGKSLFDPATVPMTWPGLVWAAANLRSHSPALSLSLSLSWILFFWTSITIYYYYHHYYYSVWCRLRFMDQSIIISTILSFQSSIMMLMLMRLLCGPLFFSAHFTTKKFRCFAIWERF